MKEYVTFKGTATEYVELHTWVKQTLGKAKYCEYCGTKSGVIDWCNVSQEYHRNTEDWVKMCHRCHRRFDRPTHWRWEDGTGWLKLCKGCNQFLVAEDSFYKRKTKQKDGSNQAEFTVWCKPCTQEKLSKKYQATRHTKVA